ncbi:unnamed protein product [Dibothriocephalus latus]|uniref:BRO1 domain-containing protein n=1 Tax=Dibothriocephalus latus TaxID=60516 RepID=A0A3P7L5C6_DIBLA|nr:unnamed protein product [Dibothriocephalus latus]
MEFINTEPFTIPPKQFDQTEIFHLLDGYTKNKFSSKISDNAKLREGFTTIHNMRRRIADCLTTDVSGYTRSEDRVIDSIKYIKLYIDLLTELEKYFIIDERGMPINFEWYNCFDESRLSVFLSSEFERGCMVFCLAALYSAYAANAAEDDAIVTYKEASEFFRYLRDNLSDRYSLEGATDLSVEALTAFSLIMQAQGEELSVVKKATGINFLFLLNL